MRGITYGVRMRCAGTSCAGLLCTVLINICKSLVIVQHDWLTELACYAEAHRTLGRGAENVPEYLVSAQGATKRGAGHGRKGKTRTRQNNGI